MYCSKCGTVMGEGDAFCTKCGYAPGGYAQDVMTGGYTPGERVGGYDVPVNYGMGKGGLWKLIKQQEGETLVKTFGVSRVRSFFLGIDADGYLSVTNKRVIYWTDPWTPGERDIVQSEMPLKDAAGVSFYKGRIFSWMHIILMYLFNIVVSILAYTLLGLIGTGSPLALKIIALIIAFGAIIGAGVFFYIRRDWTHAAIPVLANLSSVGFFCACGVGIMGAIASPLEMLNMGGSHYYGRGDDHIAWLILGLIMGLVYLFTLIMYARRSAFGMTIQSRAACGTPINIYGLRKIGFMGSLTSVGLSSEPAEESEIAATQLGAMINDLQENGEKAVKNWAE